MQASVYLLQLEGNETLVRTNIVWQFWPHSVLLQTELISQVKFTVPVAFSIKSYHSSNIT